MRNPTADKAQSKLWYQDGSWWGLLWSASANATKIHRLDVATQAWQETATVVDARASARGDALWDAKDGKLYVVSGTTVESEWSSPPSQEAVTSGSAALHRFSYNASTKTYSRDAGFPVTLHSGSTESITVAKDSVGKLWVTYTVVSADNSNRVYVNHSTTSDTAWGTPFVLPTTNAQVHHDDISAVTSFQGDKIGIMWSNQRAEHRKFYLAIHQDGQPENSWQTEVAYGGGNNCTGGCANDHLNLRQLTSDGSGRLYAAIKTAHRNVGQTFAALLVRDGRSQWTSAQFGAVEDEHTRPMVMIDEEHRQVWMFAVAPEEGGTVYYKKSPLDNVSFPPGAGTPIISSDTDTDINDPTSTKQNVNGQTGLVVLAAASTPNARYWHAHINLGDTPPGGGDTTAPTVAAVSPNDQATGVAVNTSVTGTFSEAMDATTINGTTVTLKNAAGAAVTAGVTYDATNRVVTLDPNADLAASTAYTASITTGAKDTTGNALATAKTWTFTTAAAAGGGGTAETITLEALEDSYVSSGATTTDYGAATVLGVDYSPTAISYLKFDLGPHTGKTITDAKLQLRVTNGSTGSQRVKLVPDDAWTESAIRYNSRPPLGTLTGTLTGATTAATYSVNLDREALKTELGQKLSLALDSSSSDGLDFASSENTTTTNRPKLILTLSGEGTGGGGDTTAPTVAAVSPNDQATGVAVNTSVTGTFSEAMDATTINGTTVTLKNAAGAAVTAGVTYDATNRVVTLDPNADLAASTAYTASITTGAKDTTGNALATAKTWTFTTAAAAGGGGTAETITLEALEDSYVSSGATTTDYGAATVLGVDYSPTAISYLKFDLGPHTGKTITDAKLQLRVTNGSTGSQRVKLVPDDAWTESAIRYNSRPPLGTLTGTLTGATTAATYSVNLDREALKTELGQKLSLALDSSSSDGLDFASSENTTTTNRPKLILTLTSP
ncbi:Ig-like domain-containing protein [Pseudarthrobacter sp. NKDBFgelt]|uniref:Ig-like domain-containing protein n=1 Tax=Pseudarthrobacter sp. NKDBFgelt TaxID=3384443 RepID=UPI0038D4872A